MLVYQRVHPPVLLKPATDLVRTGALAWNNSSQDPSIRTPKTTLFCWETMVNFHGERRFSHQTHGEIKSQHWNQALTEDLGRFFEKRLVCELFWGYHFWDDMALPTVWNLCRRVSASVHFCGSRSHPTREQRASNRAWPGWPRNQIQWNHPSDLYTWYIYIILYIYIFTSLITSCQRFQNGPFLPCSQLTFPWGIFSAGHHGGSWGNLREMMNK